MYKKEKRQAQEQGRKSVNRCRGISLDLRELYLARRLGNKNFIHFVHEGLDKNLNFELEDGELKLIDVEQISFHNKEELLRKDVTVIRNFKKYLNK